MAVKSITDLKTDLAALAATLSESAWKAFETDLIDSLAALVTGRGTVLYHGTLSLSGDTLLTHNLTSEVLWVFVDMGTTMIKPDFTNIDSNSLTIHWVAADEATKPIYVQIY